MNRYKVTTEVTLEVRADDETGATEIADHGVWNLEDCVPSGYYEVEEVSD